MRLKHSVRKRISQLALVDDVVKRCAGSPLAANALGSVLRGKASPREWKAVISKSIAHNKEDKILPILKLSYDDLPSHMKQCFAFCAVFPKDFDIDMELLIQLWMANGFVPKEKDIHLETTGKHIFEELVSRSSFQDVKQVKGDREDDDVYWYCPRTTCKIHDLMHDVALSAMENEVATITYEKPKQCEFLQNTCRHLFFSCDEPEALLNDSLKIRSPAIQTLLCHRRIESSLHHLGKYNSVRTLEISGCPRLRSLESSSGEMQTLECLSLHYCESLAPFLPNGPQAYSSLRRLRITHCPGIKSLLGPCGSDWTASMTMVKIWMLVTKVPTKL